MNKSGVADLVIVSGLSGSGKSVALQSLEDIGYYCIDNLPASMLEEFTRQLETLHADQQSQWSGAAVSIDARNRLFLNSLDGCFLTLQKLGVRCRILFLEAEEQLLVRRYSETRRKHPMTDGKTALIEGIRAEQSMLSPLRERAERIIDTTDSTPHQLRGRVRDFAGTGTAAEILLLIESFGFKHGTPREADFIFDIRCLPNPYWDVSLREQTGLSDAVMQFLSGYEEVSRMEDGIFAFLAGWLPSFVDENRSYITVAIGCTGGRHRSVYICERLGLRFTREGVHAQVRHRELGNKAP